MFIRKIAGCIMTAALSGIVPLTSVIVSLAPTTVMAEPVDGDQKCGPDGFILRYYGALHSWGRGGGPCNYGGNTSGYERSASREPVDGDEKCGPDGYVLRYYGALHSWGSGGSRCKSNRD
jgi:hypothetical protein